jgi:catechol 2,3-dioxygenase-like lactoylglutathione lyase family enzyme
MKHLVKQELDVGLVTADAEAARAFYRDMMGFAEQPSMSLGAGSTQYRFKIGNHLVKLNAFAQAPALEPGGVEVANGFRLLAFIIDDLPAVLGRLEGAGKRVNRMKVSDKLPYEVAFVKDADGNVLELVGLRKPAGAALTARMQVGLTVSDVERFRHFYGQIFGLKEEPTMAIQNGRTRYGFIAGKTTIKFWTQGELPTHSGAPQKRTGIRMYTATVDDIDAVHRELVEQNVTIKVPPQDFQGRARIMFAADPDGNWIEFVQSNAAN